MPCLMNSISCREPSTSWCFAPCRGARCTAMPSRASSIKGSDGAFTILDGALYTSLHRMEELGWVASEWGISDKGKRAKFYRLTPAGKRALRAETTSWHQYVTAVAGVLRAVPAAP